MTLKNSIHPLFRRRCVPIVDLVLDPILDTALARSLWGLILYGRLYLLQVCEGEHLLGLSDYAVSVRPWSEAL